MFCSDEGACVRFGGVAALLKDGAMIFGNQAATVPPFSPNGTVSMIHLSVVQQASRRIRHHPPANFDSCSTG
jgi:hypothetical protein